MGGLKGKPRLDVGFLRILRVVGRTAPALYVGARTRLAGAEGRETAAGHRRWKTERESQKKSESARESAPTSAREILYPRVSSWTPEELQDPPGGQRRGDEGPTWLGAARFRTSPQHGCCWETVFTFYIFAYCGLVVEIQPLNC